LTTVTIVIELASSVLAAALALGVAVPAVLPHPAVSAIDPAARRTAGLASLVRVVIRVSMHREFRRGLAVAMTRTLRTCSRIVKTHESKTA
jgi:hypothetical protein